MIQQAVSERTRILVADDDALVLATLSAGLRDHGYEVLEAASGAEAVRLCQEEHPQLAILDMRMPNLDGLEAARRIRASADVPVMFLSAFDDAETVDAAVAEGALGYLVKPVDVNQVVPSIEAALNRARELRALRHKETHLTHALSLGRETSVAVGLVMAHSGLTLAEAEAALRQYARSRRCKMSEVAAELLQATETVHGILGAIRAAAKSPPSG